MNTEILIVDDNSDIRNILNELITKVNSLGFETYNESPDLNDSEQIFQILRAIPSKCIFEVIDQLLNYDVI